MASAAGAQRVRVPRFRTVAGLVVEMALVVGLAGAGLATGAVLAGRASAAEPGENRPATAHAVQAAHNSPHLAGDPTDPALVALANRLDAPDFGCALHVSTDGGKGWFPVEPVPQLPAEAEKCYAPQVAFDADGTLYYLFMGLRGAGNQPVGVFLTMSEDGGRTFSDPRRVLGPRRFQARLAIDRSLGEDGRLHLVWLRTPSKPPIGGMPAPPNPIMAAHSDDGGRSWSEPVQVSDPDRQRVLAPAVAVGADNTVHVAYYDLEDDARDYRGQEGPVWEGTWSVVSATSRDGGRSFEEGVVVDDGLVPAERVMLAFTMPPPALTADDVGRVAVGWDDARRGDRDAFVARSPDGATSWRGPVRVNDDELGNGRAQYLPQLAFAAGGRLDAVFYDRRHDPQNRYAHVAYARSEDGGATFFANTWVTSQPTDSRNGQTYPIPPAEGQVEFGSQLGLLARDGQALAAWADTRNAVTTPQQAIFTAPIVLPAAADEQGWVAGGVGLGIVAVAAVVGVGMVGVWRWSWAARAARPATRPAAAAWRQTRHAAGRLPSGLRWAVVALGLIALAVVWSPSAPALPAPTVVEVTVSEGEMKVDRSSVPAGRVVVRAQHGGEQAHEVVVLPLPEDMDASLAEALDSGTKRAVSVLADLPARTAGEETVFALDLPPGRYGLVCFEEGPGDASHAETGENVEFTVRRR